MTHTADVRARAEALMQSAAGSGDADPRWVEELADAVDVLCDHVDHLRASLADALTESETRRRELQQALDPHVVAWAGSQKQPPSHADLCLRVVRLRVMVEEE